VLLNSYLLTYLLPAVLCTQKMRTINRLGRGKTKNKTPKAARDCFEERHSASKS